MMMGETAGGGRSSQLGGREYQAIGERPWLGRVRDMLVVMADMFGGV